jgi:hypothetical protein
LDAHFVIKKESTSTDMFIFHTRRLNKVSKGHAKNCEQILTLITYNIDLNSTDRSNLGQRDIRIINPSKGTFF